MMPVVQAICLELNEDLRGERKIREGKKRWFMIVLVCERMNLNPARWSMKMGTG
jgi:hypothetical protein